MTLNDPIAVPLGLQDLREIPGGHQSTVFSARLDDQVVALKLVDARFFDRRALETRLRLLVDLGAKHPSVCAPIPLDGQLLHELELDGAGRWYAAAYRFADGDPPDLTDRWETALLGRVLAELHEAMAGMPPVDLPPLAAFRHGDDLREFAADLGLPITPIEALDLGADPQLVHGDFSWKNVRIGPKGADVFDFDDCGYGPVEFDVALSLYMVLFVSMTEGAPDTYTAFRRRFLAAYEEEAGRKLAPATLDALITQRVVMLAWWLAHPTSAPAGIQGSSEVWRTILHRFVGDYRSRQ